jgi:hypothetical protein
MTDETGNAEAKRPVRIQRKRTRGWRMPKNTVYVGRPSKWGNPFTIGRDGDRAEVIEKFRAWLSWDRSRSWIYPDLSELRGKNLACWCPLADKEGSRVPCHADVLLEIANA